MPRPASPRALPRAFFLSPAHCGGKRAQLLLSGRAQLELAQRLREPAGAPLGEVMSFVSGLYFRAKLAYARSFSAAQPFPAEAVRVISAGAGLFCPEARVTHAEIVAWAGCTVDPANPRFREPLERDARAFAARWPDAEVVLLGSVASGKYLEPLLEVFGERLSFPAEFVGRGDMSRGGLMLRCVREQRELAYVRARDSARRRPPRPARSS